MSESAQNKRIEEIILEIEGKVFVAIQQKDVNTFSRFLADDFVYRTSNGAELRKEEFLQGIVNMPMEITFVRGENQRVNVYGDVAVLTGVQHAEWRQGDMAEGVSSVAFTDIFVRRGEKWLMVLAYGVELPE